MTETRMPTTLPSPVDRGEFRFLAVDAAGTAWRWMDDEMVWVRAQGEMGADDSEAGGCDVRH